MTRVNQLRQPNHPGAARGGCGTPLQGEVGGATHRDTLRILPLRLKFSIARCSSADLVTVELTNSINEGFTDSFRDCLLFLFLFFLLGSSCDSSNESLHSLAFSFRSYLSVRV